MRGRPAKLVISLLGPPRIEGDGAAIALTSHKAVALLAYLAATGQPHDRDFLADLLYPDLDRDRARSNIRQALYLLRGAIGEEWLSADGQTVGLAGADSLSVDVLRLRQLLGEAKGADTAVALPILTEAAGLFRGEFLAGFYLKHCPGFEQWQLGEQESLRRDQRSILGRLVQAGEAHGDTEGAIEWGRQLVALDPLDEDAQRTLMRVYAAAGRKAEALRQYESCRMALERELQEEPDEETEELRRSIVSGSHDGSGPRVPPTNLRSQPTPFIGRKPEVAAVVAALRKPGVQLLTLTGAGGIGKTRLAIQAAARLLRSFRDGVFFVDLAPVRDPAEISQTIASTMGVLGSAGDRRSIPGLLRAHLGAKKLLLVLDNFEHLVAGAPEVALLLSSCPGIRVLATSREPLHLRAEHELAVPPLRVPGHAESALALRESEAVRLFVERASAAQPDLSITAENARLIGEICRRLDGLPLAIELAAAKVKVFALSALLQQLDHRLRLLVGGPQDLPERQRTLRSEIEWSYELLCEPERRVFRGLSVFVGGCTREAAEAVCGSDAMAEVASLVDKSLVVRRVKGEQPRFSMLQTIREYAAERLEESGKAGEVRARFAEHLLAVAEGAEPKLYGPEQREWLDHLDCEADNLRAALSWLHEAGRIEAGLRLAGALGWFWFRRSHFTEGHHWLQLFRQAATGAEPAGCRAKVTYYLAWVQRMTGTLFMGSREVTALYRESALLWQEAGDVRHQALAQVWAGCPRTFPGLVEDVDQWPLTVEAVGLARASADPWAVAMCIIVAFSQWPAQVAPELAFEPRLLEEAIALARETGDPFLHCQALLGMGRGLSSRQATQAALPWYSDSIAIAREVGDTWSLLSALHGLAMSCWRLDQLAEAKRLLGEGLRLAADSGARGWLHWIYGGFDWVARKEGRPRRAVRLWAAACRDPFPETNPRESNVTATLGLTEEIAEAEWKIGHEMTTEEAVAYALSDED